MDREMTRRMKEVLNIDALCPLIRGTWIFILIPLITAFGCVENKEPACTDHLVETVLMYQIPIPEKIDFLSSAKYCSDSGIVAREAALLMLHYAKADFEYVDRKQNDAKLMRILNSVSTNGSFYAKELLNKSADLMDLHERCKQIIGEKVRLDLMGKFEGLHVDVDMVDGSGLWLTIPDFYTRDCKFWGLSKIEKIPDMIPGLLEVNADSTYSVDTFSHNDSTFTLWIDLNEVSFNGYLTIYSQDQLMDSIEVYNHDIERFQTTIHSRFDRSVCSLMIYSQGEGEESVVEKGF